MAKSEERDSTEKSPKNSKIRARTKETNESSFQNFRIHDQSGNEKHRKIRSDAKGHRKVCLGKSQETKGKRTQKYNPSKKGE
jgi:hypothetical protein